MNTGATDQPHGPGWYEIRLRGHLALRWSAWLDGMDISTDTDGTSVLRGPVVDQAALHGLLSRLGDIGIPLISVARVEPGRAQRTPSTNRSETDMTTTAAQTTGRPTPTRDPMRNNVRASGIFYLLTFAASIPALLLLGPVINNPDYIVSAGQDNQVLWGCFLDFVNALAGIGSAVAVFPVVRRANESLALGFVMSRMVEAAVIMIGVVALVTVVVLRQDVGGSAADASALTTTGHALVTGRDWTFLLGPGFMACVNAVLFGSLLYRSGLVPRFIPAMGLIGAPLLLTANLVTFFGHNTQTGGWSMLATLPVAAWELSVGSYMMIKGFKPSPVTT